MNENLKYVAEVFDWISSRPGRKDKEAGLVRLRDAGGEIEEIAKGLLSIALDWYRHYHVATLPELQPEDCDPSDVWDVKTFFHYIERLEQKQAGMDVKLVLRSFHYEIAKWLRRCILKDLKMGVQETTVNKVWPGLIRTFSCALAEDCNALDDIKFPIFGEAKIDGVRAIVIIKPEDPNVGIFSKVEWCSRSGNELFNLDNITKELLLSIPQERIGAGIVLDGELFAKNLHHTLGLVRSSKTKRTALDVDELRYHLFDLIPLDQWNAQNVTLNYRARRSILSQSLGGTRMFVLPILFSTLGDTTEASEFYERQLKNGYEGMMLKDPHARYIFGRSSAWLKHKPFDLDPFSIVGHYEGEGRLAGMLGGFNVEISEDKICAVGGGLSDQQRVDFWERRASLVGKRIVVKYKEKSKDGVLREPVFVRFE